MSLLRLARPKHALGIPHQRRFASSNHQNLTGHNEATPEYPTEGFSGPFWRKTALLTILVTGVVNFAPPGLLTGSASMDVDEAPWLTRVLAHYSPPKDFWVKSNEKHLLQTEEVANNTLLVQSAKRPPVHRYRYPLSFEQSSPHLLPVGGCADMSDLVVKGDKS